MASLIAKLYAIEKASRMPIKTLGIKPGNSPQYPTAKIYTWLDKTLHSTLPKGLLGKTLSYLDKN